MHPSISICIHPHNSTNSQKRQAEEALDPTKAILTIWMSRVSAGRRGGRRRDFLAVFWCCSHPVTFPVWPWEQPRGRSTYATRNILPLHTAEFGFVVTSWFVGWSNIGGQGNLVALEEIYTFSQLLTGHLPCWCFAIAMNPHFIT